MSPAAAAPICAAVIDKVETVMSVCSVAVPSTMLPPVRSANKV